jgi:hypothetical protein
MAERVTQEVVEPVYTPSGVAERTTQEVVEPVYVGNPPLRLEQLAVEVAYLPDGSPPTAGGASYAAIIV